MAQALFVTRCGGVCWLIVKSDHVQYLHCPEPAPQFPYLIGTPRQIVYSLRTSFSATTLCINSTILSNARLCFYNVPSSRNIAQRSGNAGQVGAETVKQLGEVGEAEVRACRVISCTCDACVTYKAKLQVGDAHNRRSGCVQFEGNTLRIRSRVWKRRTGRMFKPRPPGSISSHGLPVPLHSPTSNSWGYSLASVMQEDQSG
jgi:hypothetical protein